MWLGRLNPFRITSTLLRQFVFSTYLLLFVLETHYQERIYNLVMLK